jgi:hypothetical protein
MLCILTGVCIAGGIVTAICTLAASAS